MITDGMIEASARAICAAHGYRDPYIDTTWHKYVEHARASISAALSASPAGVGVETAATQKHAVGSWRREHDALGELIRLLDEEPSIGDAEIADALEKARCAWDHSRAPSSSHLQVPKGWKLVPEDPADSGSTMGDAYLAGYEDGLKASLKGDEQ